MPAAARVPGRGGLSADTQLAPRSMRAGPTRDPSGTDAACGELVGGDGLDEALEAEEDRSGDVASPRAAAAQVRRRSAAGAAGVIETVAGEW